MNSGELIHYFGDETDNISDVQIKAYPVIESLALIHLTEADNSPDIYPDKKQTRIRFVYEGYKFKLSLTDETYPIFESKFSKKDLLEDFYVTIGLGQSFHTATNTNMGHYKFVAGFIPTLRGVPYEDR